LEESWQHLYQRIAFLLLKVALVPEKRRVGRREKVNMLTESELEYLDKQDGSI